MEEITILVEETIEEVNILAEEVSGPQGISPYRLAQLNGFTGTVEEWLASLKGAAFTYEDFTPEQLEALRGPAFTYADFTPEQLAMLKGAAFTYNDFTPEQLEALRGPAGAIQDISGKVDKISGYGLSILKQTRLAFDAPENVLIKTAAEWGVFLATEIQDVQYDGSDVYLLSCRPFILGEQLSGNAHLVAIESDLIEVLASTPFIGCPQLVYLAIPNCIEFLGSDIFTGVTSLVILAVSYPLSISNGGFPDPNLEYALANNPGLSQVEYSKSIEDKIGLKVDKISGYGLTELKSIYLQYDSADNIPYQTIAEWDAFFNCNFNEVRITNNEVALYIFDVIGLISNLFNGNLHLTDFNSDAIEYVGNDCFKNCAVLRGVYIQSDYCELGESIGDNDVFNGVTTLESVQMPYNLSYINNGSPDGDLIYALANNPGLINIEYGNPTSNDLTHELNINKVDKAPGLGLLPLYRTAIEFDDIAFAPAHSEVEWLALIDGNSEVVINGNEVNLYSAYKDNQFGTALQNNTHVISFFSTAIQEIISEAFLGCTELRELKIANDKLNLGDTLGGDAGVFTGITSLIYFEVPYNLSTINEGNPDGDLEYVLANNPGLSGIEYVMSELDMINELDDIKEEVTNKVTSVSSLSTNDQYPSAKLVYDKSIEDLWYGIQWDINVSSPVCARIGKAELHRELPIQSLIRGCILSDAGEVNYYLDPLDWTKKADGTASDLSGAAGQVMVEIPSHYRKFETFLSLRKCKISQYALPGYTYVPKFYIGAYEATVQRSTLKLSSVVNATADYRGGDNSNWDSLSKSLLGRPASAISRINFRTYARNRGSVNWNMLTYDAYKSLFYLYYVEYANLNSQTAINAAKDVNGYTQGGLGNGVTDLNGTEWSTFNGYNPFVPCGHTNSLGNYSGEITYSAIDFGGTGVTRTTKANRYRGIENPFGHIWKWVDGVNVEIQSVASGNLSRLYVASNPADFSNTGYVNYTLLGNIPRADGYVKEMILGEIMPANTVGAGSTTFFSDYFYTSVPASGIDLRGVIFGGAANTGASAGFGCALTYNAPSYATAYIGSRLCFLGA